MEKNRSERWKILCLRLLLVAGLVMCLVQVWVPAFFLTGDGPCHVSNAQILHDIWCNEHADFYTRFFNLNYKPNPNWLATFAMALLLYFVKGVIAEKIFLTLYLLIYSSGFYLLLRKTGSKSS